MAAETWLPIPGFADYEVSDLGRIRSFKSGKPRVLSMSPNHHGYPTVWLRRDGQTHSWPVHLLVLLTFRGPRPLGLFGLHSNDSKQNCRLTNLYYGDRSQNGLDSVANGTHANARKVKCRNGHDYNRDNTYHVRVNGRMRRECRECQRDWRAARRAVA